MCYEDPEEHDFEQGLIPVDLSAVEELETYHYPDAKDLMRTSTKWFLDIINILKAESRKSNSNIMRLIGNTSHSNNPPPPPPKLVQDDTKGVLEWNLCDQGV